MADTMRLDIVTPQRAVYSSEAEFVLVPTIDGSIGILPNHAPLITALDIGIMKVVNDGKDEYLAIGKGFMEVKDNLVTLLADTAEKADEIDFDRAQAAKARAEKRLSSDSSDVDVARAQAALRRANVRLSVYNYK